MTVDQKYIRHPDGPLKPLRNIKINTSMRAVTDCGRNAQLTGWVKRVLLLATVTLLAGCEAPLVLDGVQSELNKPIRRSDRFQAAVSNDNVLVVVGSYGVILTSTDNGQAWTRREIDETPSFIDATACPDGSIAVLAVERRIWTSTDNGKSWHVKDLASEETPQALTCDPSGRLWVVGSFSSILSSSDLGASWQIGSLDDDLILTYVKYFNKQQGLVMGEFGTVAHTENGGETWERGEPMPDDFYPMAALFFEPDRGWVAGLSGAILYTEDRGQSWQRAVTETDAPIYGFAAQGDELYAVGDFGTVLRLEGSDFSGEHRRWNRMDLRYPVRFFLRAALPVASDGLLIGGGAGALHVIKTAELTKR